METKDVCINNNELELIDKIKGQVIELGSTDRSDVDRIICNLEYLEAKLKNDFESKAPFEISRPIDQVVAFLSITNDLIWYADLKNSDQEGCSGINLCPECQERAMEIEELYIEDDFNPCPFNYGILLGKSLALDWILGGDWNLDS